MLTTRGLTLAVLSLEAVMNMVMSLEVWMSLICLVCSLMFESCSPDWRVKEGTFSEQTKRARFPDENNLGDITVSTRAGISMSAWLKGTTYFHYPSTRQLVRAKKPTFCPMTTQECCSVLPTPC